MTARPRCKGMRTPSSESVKGNRLKVKRRVAKVRILEYIEGRLVKWVAAERTLYLASSIRKKSLEARLALVSLSLKADHGPVRTEHLATTATDDMVSQSRRLRKGMRGFTGVLQFG